MEPNYFIIRYGEIGIKGKNKPFFQKMLIRNLKIALSKEEYEDIYLSFSKVLLKLNEKSKHERIKKILKNVFGIENFSPAYSCKTDYNEIEKTAKTLASSSKAKNFKITTTRSWKGFEMKSPQMNNKLGNTISKTGKKVKLVSPALDIQVNILKDFSFVFTEKIKGPGGIPVGSADSVVSLLSGGIDSPVSSWMMMKRGCPVVMVHFFNENLGAPDKIKNLTKSLFENQPETKLYIVPFANCQKEIISKAPADYRMILYRRMMLRIANKIASKEKIKQMVTGDSVSQVASQTMENMRVISQSVRIPIYRPLIGLDKSEIISYAEKIGTFEISNKPYQDCCSFMVPKHPVTKAKLDIVKKTESGIDIKKLVSGALKGMKILNMP